MKDYTGSDNILICWEHKELTKIAEKLGDDDAPTYPDDRLVSTEERCKGDASNQSCIPGSISSGLTLILIPTSRTSRARTARVWIAEVVAEKSNQALVRGHLASCHGNRRPNAPFEKRRNAKSFWICSCECGLKKNILWESCVGYLNSSSSPFMTRYDKEVLHGLDASSSAINKIL